MVTTIQVEDRTLDILRKVKQETNSSSYDEAINKLVMSKFEKVSLAGFLGKMPIKDIMKGLRDKHDSF